jgi:hypothetical protein
MMVWKHPDDRIGRCGTVSWAAYSHRGGTQQSLLLHACRASAVRGSGYAFGPGSNALLRPVIQ